MSRKRPEREKKREERAAQEAAAPKPQSWEWRSVKFVFRCMAVLFFLGYLGVTTPSAASWVETKWALHYKLEDLPAKADDYLNRSFKPDKLHKLLSMRPVSETEKVIKLMEPHTARLSTYTFLLYSMRLKTLSGMALAKGDKEEARAKMEESLFWWQFARYRARFDALRCGSPFGVDNLKDVLKMIPHPDFPPDTQNQLPIVIRDIKRVLELDAQHPADNLPEDLCDLLRSLEDGKYASVGIDRWANIRHGLRYLTEERLEDMEEDLKAGKTVLPEKEEAQPSLRDIWNNAMKNLKK